MQEGLRHQGKRGRLQLAPSSTADWLRQVRAASTPRHVKSLTAVLLGVVFVACSSTSETPAPPAVAPEDDASPPVEDAGAPPSDAGDSGLSGKCADTFGSALTAGFGRVDGVVYAVQKPSDTTCVFPNDDHVIVQVLMGGAVYRMVVNVQSDRAGSDPKVRFAALEHPLPEPAFADGWHSGVALDYPSTLGAHNTAGFEPVGIDTLVTRLATELVVGEAVSVYATCGAGRPESAHLIHRNPTNEDGAIVVAPTSASPRFLLFHFDEQTF